MIIFSYLDSMFSYYLVLVFFHLIGIVLGVGGATAGDLVFFRSAKDKKLSKDEYNILSWTSKLVWMGFSLVTLSGVLLVLLEFYTKGSSPRFFLPFFQAKIFLVLIIFLNGLVMHFKELSLFKKGMGKKLNPEKSEINLLALTGSISVSSWYGILFLATFKPSINVAWILLTYFGIVFSGFIIAKFLFKKFFV